MYNPDLMLLQALMQMNVDEAQRRAEAYRLSRQAALAQRAGSRQPSRLARLRDGLLYRLGNLLVAVGRRLEQLGPAQSLPLEREMS